MHFITTAQNQVDLKRLTRDELVAYTISIGQPKYRASQVFDWLFKHGVRSFDEMQNLPKAFRDTLSEKAHIRNLVHVQTQKSRDGTEKTAYALPSGRLIETVIIPDYDRGENGRKSSVPKRVTVCVSSQVGCAMACSFCATGKMGFHENLSACDIYDQVRLSNDRSLEQFGRPVSNVVFMGMGEPLLNYDEVVKAVALLTDDRLLNLSAKRITISTVGLASRIIDLADAAVPANLAVSLHAPTEEKRSSIMPVNRKRKTDLAALREAIVYYANKTGKRVTYEYCMFAGFNDSAADAARLAEVANWANSKINLIMYNSVSGLDFERTSEENLNRFVKVLVDKGALVTVRRSRGQDIAAACGQLATAHEKQPDAAGID